MIPMVHVAPKGMIKSEEIPVFAGLLEFDFEQLPNMINREREHYLLFSNPVPAPLHSRIQPSWGLICSMVRHINKDIGKQTIADLNEQIRLLKLENQKQKELLTALVNNEPYFEWDIKGYRK